MKTNIIRIGNSQGVRIPKVLLEQSRLGREVELEVEDEKIVIRPVTRPRQGWEEQLRALSDQGEDAVSVDALAIANEWDEDEWEW